MTLIRMIGSVLMASTAGLGLLAGCDNDRAGEELYEERAVGAGVANFNQFDANGDGFLSQQEFNAIYDSWDANNDGRIARDEYRF